MAVNSYSTLKDNNGSWGVVVGGCQGDIIVFVRGNSKFNEINLIEVEAGVNSVELTKHSGANKVLLQTYLIIFLANLCGVEKPWEARGLMLVC